MQEDAYGTAGSGQMDNKVHTRTGVGRGDQVSGGRDGKCVVMKNGEDG